MRIHWLSVRIAVVVAILTSLMLAAIPSAAVPIGDDNFWRTWARTDKPIADGHVARTWMWGPEAFTGVLQEPYAGGTRTVQYFDKSRMEINDPFGDPNSTWYVTNGRLSLEMIYGKQEVDYATWDDAPPNPAHVGVAGDPDDTQGPTYATFTPLLKAPKLEGNSFIVQQIDRGGNVTVDDDLWIYGVIALDVAPTVGSWVEFSQHTVADVFWEFMNAEGLVYDDGELVTDAYFINPFYSTGLPITEPYWTTVKVGGTVIEVLVQCFERRCLTYNPANPDGWQVEAGNVGQHYYTWRYEQQPPSPVPADQEIIYAWNIADWEPYQDEDASIAPVGDALHFTTYSDVQVFGWLDTGTGDYSVSIDTRLVDIGAGDPELTLACVAARIHEDFEGNYALCLYADGWVTADYEYYDEEGVYQYDELVEGHISDLLGPVSDWNTLKIVVKGNQIWFLINGSLFGSATHDGPLSGMAGMYAITLDGTPVEWAFTNFNVYSIE